MFDILRLPSVVTVAAVVLSAILFKEFVKKRPDQIAAEGSADNDSARENGTVERAVHSCTSSQVNETAKSSGFDYEVFLSFRGPDTRNGITDVLYTNLTDMGIRAYRDNEELHIGEEIGPELLQAIDHSKISIPIFSKGYASSEWCLKELVQMVKCQKTKEHNIMPIFYDVAPSEVKHQTGEYGEAFLLHEKKKRYNKETIREWKDALSAAGALRGWDKHGENRREGEFAKAVAQEVSNVLKKAYLVTSGNLVSVDDHVEKILEALGSQTGDTRIIGIHGMGGVGKTTLAQIIYNRLLNNFSHHRFLSSIREKSKPEDIKSLQRELISGISEWKQMDIRNSYEGMETIKDRLSNKKVLILLDDLEEIHMEELVGERDWFGKGSKIIITTRRKDILNFRQVDWMYELCGMDSHQSLQLFCKHAFRRNSPLDGYTDLSNRAVDIAGGLPLALEVIGSLLSRIGKEKWDGKLKELKNVPPQKVQSRLEISYNALRVRERHIFLDIACIFIGQDKERLAYFWESKFHPKEAMDVLENMSLIKIIEGNKVWMHDLLKDLGREIVRRKSDMRIHKQSRVWDPKEGLDLLRMDKVKKDAEALRLELDYEQQCHLTYEGFENLSGLRFLEVGGILGESRIEDRLLWLKSPSNVNPTSENSCLLPNLRWLSWRWFPPAFNIANFSMKDVVFLDLSNSQITDEWKGWSHMEVMKNLRSLNLSRCRQLKRLPDELGANLRRLEYLSLHLCDSLDKLPDTIGDLKSLIQLDISGTFFKELPASIGNLQNLKVVVMQGNHLEKLPGTFWTLKKLEEIRDVAKDGKIGDSIYACQSLRILNLFNVGVYELPRLPESLVELQLILNMDKFPDLSSLTNLKVLRLRFVTNRLVECATLRWIGNLSKLEFLGLTLPRGTTSPTELSLPPQLESLRLWCPSLRGLPMFPSSLSSINLSSCSSLCSMGDLSNLKNLSSLLIDTGEVAEIQGLGCLENLRDLTLSHLGHLESLPDLRNLNKLRSLWVFRCDSLVEIQGELSPSLDTIYISDCRSLRRLPDLSTLTDKTVVEISLSYKINPEAIFVTAWKNPRHLRFYRFEQLHIIPDLSNLHNSNEIVSLTVHSCDNLVEIQGHLPRSLEMLEIRECGSLQKLPNLSSLKRLRKVVLKDCRKLDGEAIFGFARRTRANVWENLKYLTLSGLRQVEKLPDLSNSNKLRILIVERCHDLLEIQGDLPQSLETLSICKCGSLQKLHDLSTLKGLWSVVIQDCRKLNGEALFGFARRSGVNVWENLVYLTFSGLRQVEILPDLSNSNKLRHLKVKICGDLFEIQGNLPQSLVQLEISSCKSLQKFPDLLSLKELQKVIIEYCRKLNGEVIFGFAQRTRANVWENILDVRLSGLRQVKILPDLSSSKKLRHLEVNRCGHLVEIQGDLPQSLVELKISSCKSLQKMPDLSSLKGLREVAIEDCRKLNGEAIFGFAQRRPANFLENLRHLKLSDDGLVKILPDLSNLNKLTLLQVERCGHLVEIQGDLPQSLMVLEISSCESLEELPDLSSLKGLQKVLIKDCRKLNGEAICGIAQRRPANLEDLQYMWLSDVRQMMTLPDLSNSKKLRHLQLQNFRDLVEIQGKLPESLEKLQISSCESLQKLPDLSSLKELRMVKIICCGKLNLEAISSFCLEKSIKFIGEN